MIDYDKRLNLLLTYIKQMSFSWDFFEFDFQENRNFLDYYFWDEYYDDVKSCDCNGWIFTFLRVAESF